MSQIRMHTDDVYDHVPRILDTLRKMGFHLNGLSVESSDQGHVIELDYEARGSLNRRTFEERLWQNDGLIGT